MERTIDSNKDFMHFSEFYECLFLQRFPISIKKSPIIMNIQWIFQLTCRLLLDTYFPVWISPCPFRIAFSLKRLLFSKFQLLWTSFPFPLSFDCTWPLNWGTSLWSCYDWKKDRNCNRKLSSGIIDNTGWYKNFKNCSTQCPRHI